MGAPRWGGGTAKQDFGMIQEEVGEVFSKNPIEGIVGLGLPAMAAQGPPCMRGGGRWGKAW